jgi:hypothetical protein
MHMMDRSSSRERRLGTRFPLQLPIRYRAMNEPTWHDARTENIGRSGVSFLADETLQVNTRVELVFSLPVELGGSSGVTTICHGRVVRTETSTSSHSRGRIAATIDDFVMTHGDPRRI